MVAEESTFCFLSPLHIFHTSAPAASNSLQLALTCFTTSHSQPPSQAHGSQLLRPDLAASLPLHAGVCLSPWAALVGALEAPAGIPSPPSWPPGLPGALTRGRRTILLEAGPSACASPSSWKPAAPLPSSGKPLLPDRSCRGRPFLTCRRAATSSSSSLLTWWATSWNHGESATSEVCWGYSTLTRRARKVRGGH